MKFAFTAALAAVAFVQSVVGQASITINTPANVVVCQPILLTWSGGTAPYFLSILPGSQPSAPALVDFGRQNGTSLTWKVNVAVGTSIGLTLRDSNGLVAQSAPFTVNNGTDTTCVGQAVSTSAGTAVATNTAPAPAPGSTTPPTSAAPPSGGTTSTARPAGTPSGAAASPSGAASPNKIPQMGLAGVVGAAVLALLA